ncbi:MAG: NAD(P)H-dependent oxidoreductase [Candidatus Melainabacteria bacterium]|nr:NAD(P)H-dependent oxidoreductase [Candidatus Melainabacteria bacterium]
MNPGSLVDKLEWRYATKKFDPNRKIEDRTWEAIQKALVLTPSSYGLQPWKFVVVTDTDTKSKLVEASFNQNQPAECSHLVVICRLDSMDREHVEKYASHILATRGITADSIATYKSMMLGFVDRTSKEDLETWMAKQCYIALGNLIAVASGLGVDNCPMEGFDRKRYDEILELEKRGCRSVVLCALGYRAEDDHYAQLAKVRFDDSDVIIRV